MAAAASPRSTRMRARSAVNVFSRADTGPRPTAVSLTCRITPPCVSSTQNVAHVRATDSCRLPLLLVVAGQHLADQPKRQELDTDDDEEHAEQEQRPLADPRAADLHSGEIGEDDNPDERRGHADPSEQMERAMAVAPHEDDCQEVEGRPQVALDPEP